MNKIPNEGTVLKMKPNKFMWIGWPNVRWKMHRERVSSAWAEHDQEWSTQFMHERPMQRHQAHTACASTANICLKPTKQFKVKSSLLRNYLWWRVTSLFLALTRHLHETHKPTRHTTWIHTTAKNHAETDKPKCTITSSDYLICIAFVFFLFAKKE